MDGWIDGWIGKWMNGWMVTDGSYIRDTTL